MHGIEKKNLLSVTLYYKPYNFCMVYKLMIHIISLTICRVYNKFLCSTLAGQAQANLLIIKTLKKILRKPSQITFAFRGG